MLERRLLLHHLRPARREAAKFFAMLPVRAIKYGGWLLEWPYSIWIQKYRSPRQQSILVLSQPRSGSTLLYNLLAWNKDESGEIAGYGENSAGYRGDRDLRRLRIRTMLYLRRSTLPPYTADKVVRSRYRIGPAVLTNPDCYFVFLERNPEDVLASFQRKFQISGDSAAALYESRAADLDAQWALAGNRIRVSYEQLVAEPEAVLGEISQFLGLKNPLSCEYRIPPNVNNFAFGDNESRIRHGRVVAPESVC